MEAADAHVFRFEKRRGESARNCRAERSWEGKEKRRKTTTNPTNLSFPRTKLLLKRKKAEKAAFTAGVKV